MLLEIGMPWEAVCALHEALAVSPQDPIATDLLGRALEENASLQGWGSSMQDEDSEDRVFEDFIGRSKEKIGSRRVKGKARARRSARVSEMGEDSMMIMSDDEE